MILNSLVGKKVRLLWVDAQTDPDDFEILAFDPSTGWVCVRRLQKQGTPPESLLPTLVRAEDIDQIIIIDPTCNMMDFNKMFNGFVQSLQPQSLTEDQSSVQTNITNQKTQNTGSDVHATMTFDLPKAGEEFYICTRASNAFGVLWELGLKLKEDLKNPSQYKSAEDALKKINKFLMTQLKDADVNIEW